MPALTNLRSMVAFSSKGVTKVAGYKNMLLLELLAKLALPSFGLKDGSHFLRTNLQLDCNGECLSRSDIHTQSIARLIVIDADSRVNAEGEILQGAPLASEVSKILKSHNIAHVLYGSYSHYSGDKGSRYRVLLWTNKTFNKAQLAPTVEAVINLINAGLKDNFLVNVKENNTWAQPWYMPRKPAYSKIDTLYFEHLDGEFVDVHSPLLVAPFEKIQLKHLSCSNNNKTFPNLLNNNKISVIPAFNKQYPLKKLLLHYGYKKIRVSDGCEKWISSDSKSGVAGITVWQERFYSHHDDIFNDGKPHDSFDLFRVKEGLSYKEAVIKAAKVTRAPNGLSVDEHNKQVWLKANSERNNNLIGAPAQIRR